MHTALRVLQVAAVIGLVVWAAALATPPGRLPIALRALRKTLGAPPAPDAPVSLARRICAFLLVLAALAVAAL